MSQRDSGYERKERDLYETPAWVTHALVAILPQLVGRNIIEPACGSGKMVRAMQDKGLHVTGFDIADGRDFLQCLGAVGSAVVTNPPYVLAQEFCEHAIELMRPVNGLVAMLLRTDFDHAKTRQHLFSGCPNFARKLVLTKRIKWFEDSKGQPSFNHAWYIWDHTHQGAPTLAYGP